MSLAHARELWAMCQRFSNEDPLVTANLDKARFLLAPPAVHAFEYLQFRVAIARAFEVSA